MNYIYRLLILILIFFTINGCISKTTNINPNDINLTKNGLIIGTFSRNKGKAYFNEHAFKIYDKNNNYIKTIYNLGKEKLSLTNPYHFKDDFTYKNSNGSIFSFTLPNGNYSISDFQAGFGTSGFIGDYTKTINVSNNQIIYIGDIKFEPTKITDGNLLKNKIPLDAKCTISDKLNRDKSIFKQYLKTDHNISNNTEHKTFYLQHLITNKSPIKNNDDIYHKPKKREKLSSLSTLAIIEGMFIFNSYLASNNPNGFGAVFGLMVPIFGSSYDKNNNYQWTPILLGESIALYNLTIDEDNYSKHKVFNENMLMWHLLILAGYMLDDDKNNQQLSLLPTTNYDGMKLSYNYKF